ncbi:MAG: hypothetical protein V1709_00975 [Planctomycetota bacterium]
MPTLEDWVIEQLKNKSFDYAQGWINGIKAFAWWKDGEQFVGTSGKKLSDIVVIFNKLHFPVYTEQETK